MFNLLFILLGCDTNKADECVDFERTSIEDPSLKETAISDIQLGLDLHQEVKSKKEHANTFISPYSITGALGMLHLGAAGETSDQMAGIMGIGEDPLLWHSNKGLLIQELHQPDRCDYQISIANQLFAQSGYPLKDQFLEDLDSYYGAPLMEKDFSSDATNARKEINQWVSDQTMGHIPELFGEQDINSSTVLVLTNAIYMNAPWKEPFHADNTINRSFVTESGDTVQAPTMFRQDMNVRVFDTETFRAVNLPYEGDELSMTIYLPSLDNSLSDVENILTPELLSSVNEGLSHWTTNLFLPKFEIRSKLQLKDTLEDLGMDLVFGPHADLSNLSDGSLQINTVVHEAWVKVSETGTEAAAATGIAAFEVSMPEEIYVDRAFAFTIQDDLTGAVLFMGRVANPLE